MTDKEYFETKNTGRGAAYIKGNYYFPMRITYIFGKPWWKIAWYNIVLYWRWFSRKYMRW